MKKLFSLLLVVAMIASMSIVSFAADTNVMKAVFDETAEGILVTVTVTNPTEFYSTVVSFKTPKNLTWDKTFTMGAGFEAMAGATAATFNTSKADMNRARMNLAFPSTDAAVTASGEKTLFTFVLTRDAGNDVAYTSADFAYLNASGYYTNISPVTGTKLESTKNPDNFIAPVYEDKRGGNTPVVELGDAAEELKSADYAAASAADKGTLTFVAKVSAEKLNEAYGVIVAGKKFFGAPASSIADPDFAWDGSFEIVLNNITEKGTAGEKSFQYFVGDALTNAATVNVVVE